MTLRTFAWEGQSAGTNITGALTGTGASNPIIDSGGFARFQTSSPYEGLGYARFEYPASGPTGVFQALAPVATNVLLASTLAFRLNSTVTGSPNVSIASYRTSGGPLFSIRIVWASGTPSLWLYYGSTPHVQIGTGSLSTATWYRVSLETNGTSGAYVARLRNGTTDAQIGSDATGSNAGFVGTIASVRAGASSPLGSQPVIIDIDWAGLNDGSTTEIAGPAPAAAPPTIDVAQPAENLVDLRGSAPGDASAITYSTPTHQSGPTLTVSSITSGVWLFSRDASADSVYRCTVSQADLQTDYEDVTIEKETSELVNANAPLRALNTPPSNVWG